MNNSIWRKKPLEAYAEDVKNSQLKRVLGKWALTSLGIGAVIGGGIFTLTGIAAHDWAGPALALAFVLAGTACTFAALCYAEFASILPVEGSAYAYSYGTVGEFFAWFIGWNLILEYMMGATTVAVAWSGYFEKLLHLFNINLPLYLTNDPVTAAEKVEKLRAAGQAVPEFAFAFNLPAFIIVWLVTWVLVKGIKEAASTNNLIVIMKVAAVIFVIVVGAFYVDTANWHPFIPDPVVDAKGATHFGFDGVVTAASIIFFAYIGLARIGVRNNPKGSPFRYFSFNLTHSIYIIKSRCKNTPKSIGLKIQMKEAECMHSLKVVRPTPLDTHKIKI